MIREHAPELLWTPSEAFRDSTNIAAYQRWLADGGVGEFTNYGDLWTWSVDHLEDFWASIWTYFKVDADPTYSSVLSDRNMPGARWFDGARLSYPEHIFRNAVPDRPALIWRSESTALQTMGWDELREVTGALATRLQESGVGLGDRVVAFMPNIPETVIAFLAVTSIGAVWATASPDFGAGSLVDRFLQIGPKVLFAVDGYRYNGVAHDRRSVVAELQDRLPTLELTVLVPNLDGNAPRATDRTISWSAAVRAPGRLEFQRVPSDHPLWVVYTSGTTGLPKAIVHGHGGVLLERLKSGGLHGDVRPRDVYFWYTTTGWVMWNLNLSALLSCSTIVLYDGSPWYPARDAMWALVEQAEATIFGTSAAFLTACMREGQKPGADHDLSRVRMIGATASPLPPEGFRWVYEAVKPDVWLASSSGGTDVATAFVGGCPTLPVYAGEIQCRALGVDVQAYDDEGVALFDQVGELVVRQPMPSMPLFLWNDADGSRYRESYFNKYPGMWTHGDWITITGRGTAMITGRSDSTINKLGVRVGTGDVYSAVEELPEVLDSLVVEVETRGNETEVQLFVVLTDGTSLDEKLQRKIRSAIGDALSPRHVPDSIRAVPEIPRTLNGKKLEVPVKRILMGTARDSAVAIGSVANPDALEFFVTLSRQD
ncbi:MAG: acetoacetyl-CoA synthetase [Chloroflexota bacterium]|nr:acetoacetyl-CoA synthetase [Chloroflexota bacterium]